MLGFELLYVLIETCFVGNMPTGELQNPFVAKGMFKWLLAGGTGAANKRPFAPRLAMFGSEHAVSMFFKLRK
jgi:hypothetical protein